MLQNIKNLIGSISQILPQADFYLVGGSVRDALMDGENGFNSPSIKDFDVEIFNVQPEQFTDALSKLGIRFDLVGQSFGVYKVYVDGETYDFAFPRTEKKSGVGYKGFEIEVNPFLSLEEAASRRDLTINSVMYDLKKDVFIDFFGGIKDIYRSIARPTSDKFLEDPLRVLRAFQFISRFGLGWTDSLVEYSKYLVKEKDTLSIERVWCEWEKWVTKSKFPALGIQFLVEVGWAEKEIVDLIKIQQDPTHHPEGDAFEHTLWVVQAQKVIVEREDLNKDETIIAMLTAISHDFGKANTTFFHEKKQKWVAYNHQITGVPLTESFLDKIGCPLKFRRPILTLVREHMVHLLEESNAKNVRKLINRLVDGGTSLRMLSHISEADNSGRPPLPVGISPRFMKWLETAAELSLSGETKIAPIVTGDDLISLGLQEGKELGDLLKWFYAEQIDGRLTEENKSDFVSKKFAKYKKKI